jgi:hypothetical protein
MGTGKVRHPASVDSEGEEPLVVSERVLDRVQAGVNSPERDAGRRVRA